VEFREVVRHRRMVRRFDQRPVPRDVVDRIVDIGRRAPSAGFAQGLELLVLDTAETIGAFWETTRDPEFGWEPERVAQGPTVLILPLPDARRYLERYSRPDKIAFGMDEESNWPVRFWEIDAAMATMLMLLAAVDEGLGGWFFGITYGERELLDRLGVPAHLRPIGILGLGYRSADEEPTGSWMRYRRRPLAAQIHRNGW
jgi:nitroreductase